MDVRQLAALVAIADHGTFSAAARALYTVQSNVSGHIAKLERELGVSLVDRSTGSLTPEGERVVERARRILNELDDISTDIASLNDEISGDVRLGVIGTTARWVMPQLIEAIDDNYPRLRAIVHEGSTSSLVPAVLSGRLNAAIIHLPVDDPELVIEPLFAEDLFLLTPADHPLANSSDCSIKALQDFPLLLPPSGSALRRILDRAAASADITLRARAEIDGVRLLTSLATDGFGATIVPATAIPRNLEHRFARIAIEELPQRVVAWVHRRRPTPTSATLALGALLRDTIADQAHLQPGVHLGTGALPMTRTG
jgi:LysR family hydrogen peroxide-inducible transcriptional activator